MHERYALNALLSMPPPAPPPGKPFPKVAPSGRRSAHACCAAWNFSRSNEGGAPPLPLPPFVALPPPVWVCGAPPSWNDPGGVAPADDWPLPPGAHREPRCGRRSRWPAGRRRSSSGSRHRPASRRALPMRRRWPSCSRSSRHRPRQQRASHRRLRTRQGRQATAGPMGQEGAFSFAHSREHCLNSLLGSPESVMGGC